MRNGWSYKTVGACLERINLPSGAKLLTRDYKTQGKYPVVDQGQSKIAGWTDTDGGVISEPLPVIVFGDHSRTFKYVDFPFVRGADGTQILKPREGIDPLYFFYACRSIDLSSRGYNRHFSLLKEQSIPIPDLTEQTRIGHTLQLLEGFAQLQEAQLAVTRDTKRAALTELFSRGLRGDRLEDTHFGTFPVGWSDVTIGSLGRVVTGTTPPTNDPTNYEGGTVPFVAPGDFDHGDRIASTEKALSDRGLSVSRPLPPDSTCFVCIGSTIGKVGITTAAICATNQQINSVIASNNYHPRYIFHLLTRWSEHVQRHASPSPVPILSKGAFERISVVVSQDLGEQKDIAEILDAIDDRLAILTEKRSVAEQLLYATMSQLLKGEVRIDGPDLGALTSAGAA